MTLTTTTEDCRDRMAKIAETLKYHVHDKKVARDRATTRLIGWDFKPDPARRSFQPFDKEDEIFTIHGILDMHDDLMANWNVVGKKVWFDKPYFNQIMCELTRALVALRVPMGTFHEALFYVVRIFLLKDKVDQEVTPATCVDTVAVRFEDVKDKTDYTDLQAVLRIFPKLDPKNMKYMSYGTVDFLQLHKLPKIEDRFFAVVEQMGDVQFAIPPTISSFVIAIWKLRYSDMSDMEIEELDYLVRMIHKDVTILTEFSDYEIATAIVASADLTRHVEAFFDEHGIDGPQFHSLMKSTQLDPDPKSDDELTEYFLRSLKERMRKARKFVERGHTDMYDPVGNMRKRAKARKPKSPAVIEDGQEPKYSFAKPLPSDMTEGNGFSFYKCKRAPTAVTFREMIKVRKAINRMKRRRKRGLANVRWSKSKTSQGK